MVKYLSKREKVKKLIDNLVLLIRNGKKDIDYYKALIEIQDKTSATRSIIEELINLQIKTKKIKEIRILTINDEEIKDYLKEIKKKEIDIKNEIMEAGLDGKQDHIFE